MAEKNLKQLLEEARQIMRDNEPSDCFLQLKESLRDDYYWEAMSMEIDCGEDMENIKDVKTIGYGQTPEEALIDLIGKLSNKEMRQYKDDKLWTEIEGDSFLDKQRGYLIALPDLRMILEKFKILGDEKDGM